MSWTVRVFTIPCDTRHIATTACCSAPLIGTKEAPSRPTGNSGSHAAILRFSIWEVAMDNVSRVALWKERVDFAIVACRSMRTRYSKAIRFTRWATG